MAAAKTVMGVQGAPYRPPFGSFAGKPVNGKIVGRYTVMGVQGAPFRPPFGSFAGKIIPPAGAQLHAKPFLAWMGGMSHIPGDGIPA